MHFCIVGCGGIAHKHATILRKLENFVPGKPARISFASRDLKKAEAMNLQYKGDLAFGSYEEAFAHKDIEAVVLCTPNHCHKREAILALEHGKHVIIEKPIALNTEEADEILAKAKECNLDVIVAENHRYRPSIRYLERLIQSGELGAIKFIKMNIMRTHQFKENEWRSKPEMMGGGPLIDGGIHWVNALLSLGGESANQIRALEPPTTISHCPREDSIAILCRLNNQSIGELTYSWGVHGSFPLKFIGVYGSKGSIYVSNTGMFGWRTGKFSHPILLPLKDWKGYESMWQDFLINLSNHQGSQVLTTGAVGRRDLAFVESAYQSAIQKSESKANSSKVA